MSLLAALFLVACDRQSPAPAAPARPPLRIAQSFWPGQYWVDIALDQRWFKAAGLDAVGFDSNPDYIGSLQMVAEGKLDCQNFTLYDLIRYNHQGTGLVMVLYTDFSNGADGIVARPGLARLADLRRHKIGLARGTYSEFLLRITLAREGIPEDEVEIVDMQNEKAAATLAAGTVDAVLTYEPVLGAALATVKGRLLWDTRQDPGLSPAGLTLRRAFLRERPEDVRKLLAVWQRATAFIREHPEEAYAIVARVNRVTPDVARALVAKDKILDLRENLAAFSFAAGFDSLHGTARLIDDFLLRRNLATRRIDSTEYLDARFLKELK